LYNFVVRSFVKKFYIELLKKLNASE